MSSLYTTINALKNIRLQSRGKQYDLRIFLRSNGHQLSYMTLTTVFPRFAEILQALQSDKIASESRHPRRGRTRIKNSTPTSQFSR